MTEATRAVDAHFARRVVRDVLDRFDRRWEIAEIRVGPDGDAVARVDDAGIGEVRFPLADPVVAALVVASHVQDSVVEGFRWGQALPACPGHQHPLTPTVFGGTAVWACPRGPGVHREPIVESDFRETFPALFREQHWEWGDIRARFTTAAAPADTITNVHVICSVDNGIVVCRDEQRWFLPGGTTEPGETWQQCAERELLEEAGVRPTGPLRWIGVHHGRTGRPKPYRPHLPHPDLTWLWAVAPVEVVGPPSNPPDGEQVQEVRVVPPGEALDLLGTANDWYPELVRLALLL